MASDKQKGGRQWQGKKKSENETEILTFPVCLREEKVWATLLVGGEAIATAEEEEDEEDWDANADADILKESFGEGQ